MLKIKRSANGQVIILMLSGRMDAEHVEDLKTLFKS
jgi:hypothetical protein